MVGLEHVKGVTQGTWAGSSGGGLALAEEAGAGPPVYRTLCGAPAASPPRAMRSAWRSASAIKRGNCNNLDTSMKNFLITLW